MIGRNVEIRSTAGIVYHGIIRTIDDRGSLGELFELGPAENPEYCRLVYVTDRRAQIQEIDEGRFPILGEA